MSVLKRSSVGLVGAFLAAGAIAPQSGPSLLVSAPGATLSAEVRNIGLRDFKTCQLIVTNDLLSIRSDLSSVQVERWYRNRLENAGVTVVSREEAEGALSRAPKNTDSAALQAYDRRFSLLTVDINGIRSGSNTVVLISTAAFRGGFIHPGYYRPVRVWGLDDVLLVPSGRDLAREVQIRVDSIMDEFESDLKTANGR